MPKFDTLIDVFDHGLKYHPEGTAFYSKDKYKNFIKTSFKEVYRRAEDAGIGLMNWGVEPGAKIGMMADNRLEWIICDIAILLNGAANVPRGTDSTPDEIKYILNHCGAEFCVAEHKEILDKMKKILPETKVKKIIVLDPEFKETDENTKTLQQLIDEGAKVRKEKLAELHKRRDAVKKDDLFTIIYTSGTTGAPKGVMLSHGNIAYNMEVVPSMVGINVGDRALSILPVWHIFERAMDYALIPYGGKLYYTNIRDLKDDIKTVKPSFMASAPRLWENIYNGITQRMEKETPVKKFLFNAAIEVNKIWKDGLNYLQGNKLKTEEETDMQQAANTAWSLFTTFNLLVPAKVLDSLVFSKIREALGGELRGTISGGGALPSHVDEFFNTIGIPVYEGYGMTECAPIISARTVGNVVQGTVGYFPEGTRVKILDDTGKEVPQGQKGVVHVKGPQVMQGYYNNKEATEKALTADGWMNTGDIGFISLNGTLSIRGRAKDTIVLLGGENLEPVPIENLLLENDYIDQIMVVGQDQKTLGALVWPNFGKLKEEGYNIEEGDDLNKNATLKKFYSDLIKNTITLDNGFKSYEKITTFRFLPKPFEVGDELTNLFKMKRNIITDKYENLIHDMYN